MQEHIEYCMGTAFVFRIRSAYKPAQLQVALEKLHEADSIFSLYKADSPLSQLSRGETTVAKCPPVVNQIWDECEKWEKITDGFFSPFTPEHTFDPSGLVKTWAAQEAANYLLSEGIDDFTINAGGDILISDKSSDPVDWRVGISKPISIAEEGAGVFTVLDLKNTKFRAVASSGHAERGDHIWNPRTGAWAEREVAQVSVIASDLVTADVWATACYAMGTSAIERVINYNKEHLDDHIQLIMQLPGGDVLGTTGVELLFARPN
ncbi:MAG: FAD:protein FMN transferase [Micrococcales bacterium]